MLSWRRILSGEQQVCCALIFAICLLQAQTSASAAVTKADDDAARSNEVKAAAMTMETIKPEIAPVTEQTVTGASKAENDWWRNAVVYQIYPRSFLDTNGDGVGDLRGILKRLIYLAELGVQAVWLSPIYKSPMVDFGYDITDFTSIHREYGSIEDFDDLISEATRLGIKIILDFVPNHTSNQSEWFKKSAAREPGYEDFYVWADGKTNEQGERMPPNNWQSVFYGSAWTWHDTRKQYYLHQFTAEQPDLNFRNPKVIEAMDEVLLFWLRRGVSGFRVDAINHLFEDAKLRCEPLSGKTDDKNSYDYTEHIYTKNLPEVLDMLQHWRRLLDDYTTANAGVTRILMTEAYADIKQLMDYYETSDGNDGAHLPFNFIMITDLNERSDARDFVFNIQKWMTYMPRGHVANWVMGNHDNPRVASRFAPEMVDAMNMMLLTLPGVAVTYNGEEIGMQDYRDISWEDTVDPPARNAGPQNYKTVSRDPERTPFQWTDEKNAGFSSADKTWLPVHPNYKQLNLAQQRGERKSHYKVYKALTELRKKPALQKGRLHAEVLSREVFAYEREMKDEPSIITVINISPKAQTVNLSEAFDMKGKLTVMVASSQSSREMGQELRADALKLMPHEGIVCMLE